MLCARPAGKLIRQAVLFVQIQLQPGHNACKRNIAVLPEHRKPRLQKLHIASEFVDDQSLYALPLFGPHQLHRAQKLRKDPAGINISCEQDRRVHHLRKPHIDKISLTQVDLHGASGTFDHDDLCLLLKPVIGFENLRDQRFFAPVVVGCPHLTNRSAVYDHLRGRIAHWL